MTRLIGALIVDDEALAREGIRVWLKDHSDVEITGEAADGPGAVEAIKRLLPDLVFLDIQIPGFDGFEVLRRVAPVHLPAVIFVTAYDQYACQAFEAQAIDYLLKPISSSRFEKAMQRMRRELAHDEDLEQTHRQLLQLLDVHRGAPPSDNQTRYLRWLTVKDGRYFRLVRTDEVDWIGSSLNYVELHVGPRTYMIRMTMNQLEERLDPASFVRIHRSTIVRVDAVEAIETRVQGDFAVRLRDGTVVRMSRSYRDRLIRRVP